ncbi:transmembrane protein 208 [Sabethes cyaneus]|uniref:transmembrane protein 208 n=1 Tax=Sabethes cyaneus TaxID=53552 RepID=UPI00237D45E2|nr:transmembrane protein 208 [Sabethes cyaneus]
MASKGKQGTKGSKQIMVENCATLKFYRNMCLGTTAFCLLAQYFFIESFGVLQMVMMLFSACIYFGSYTFLMSISKPKYSDAGSVLDSGNDLNIEGGIAEHMKDAIILTAGTQLLSLISDYFWLLLLLAPLRAFWLLWTCILKPWLQQKHEQELTVNEKKQRQADKKSKRTR